MSRRTTVSRRGHARRMHAGVHPRSMHVCLHRGELAHLLTRKAAEKNHQTQSITIAQ